MDHAYAGSSAGESTEESDSSGMHQWTEDEEKIYIYIRESQNDEFPVMSFFVGPYQPLTFEQLTFHFPGASGLWFMPENADAPEILYMHDAKCSPPPGGWNSLLDYYCFYSDNVNETVPSEIVDLVAYNIDPYTDLLLIYEYLVWISRCKLELLTNLTPLANGQRSYFIFRCSTIEGQNKLIFRNHEVFPFDGNIFSVRPCNSKDVRSFGIYDCLHLPVLEDQKLAQALTYFEALLPCGHVVECYKQKEGYLLIFQDVRAALYYSRCTIRVSENKIVQPKLTTVDERLRRHLARLQISSGPTYLQSLKCNLIKKNIVVSNKFSNLQCRNLVESRDSF